MSIESFSQRPLGTFPEIPFVLVTPSVPKRTLNPQGQQKTKPPSEWSLSGSGNYTVWPFYLFTYMQPYIVPPSFEGFVSIIKNMQLIRLNVYEFDKTFNNTVILHFKIIKITPECTQVTPDHIRSPPNHALGKYFLYWASPNNFLHCPPPLYWS